MKNVFFTLSLLALFFQLNAATVTWTGDGDGISWSDGDNWDTDMIPTAADDADLDGESVTLDISTAVQRVFVDGSATFTVNAGVTLTIAGFTGNDEGLEIQGSATLINDGTILISTGAGSTAEGLYNKGTSTNNGTIEIDGTGGHGLYVVAGVFTNSAAGVITVTNAGQSNGDSDNIYVDDANSGSLFGNLVNEGSITVNTNSGDDGILVNDNSTFDNTGTVTINKSGGGDEALQTEDGGEFNNNSGGVININTSDDKGIVMKSSSTFNNNSGATINIDAIDDDQIVMESGSSFNNTGVINLTNAGDLGLHVKDGTFTNMSGGEVNATDITDHSFYVQGASAVLNNFGTMTVNGGGGSSDGLRINTSGTVTNNFGGSLIFNNTGADAIQIDPNTTLNNGGTISVDGTKAGEEAMELNGVGSTFNNLAGGMYMVINCGDDGIEINNGSVINNDGAIRIDGSAGDDIETFSGYTFNNSSTATFAPGSSPGDLLTKGDWDLGASTTTFEIDGPAAYDQIVNGDNAHTLTISSATAHLEWGYTPADGDCFKIIDGSGTVGGEFLAITSSDPSIMYTVDYTSNTDEVEICVSLALPVELISFNGEKTVEGTKLTWETASEINNESFEIERSNDNRDWTKIGSVRGNGYSSSTQRYSFVDDSPNTGTNYYRLKQNDVDGNFEISNSVSVYFEKSKSEFTFYPNPVDNVLNINMDQSIEDIEIQLYNSNGVLLMTRKGIVNEIPFDNYSLGIYYLNVIDAENTVVHKIVKN